MKKQFYMRWGPRKDEQAGSRMIFSLDADSEPKSLYLEHVCPLIEKLLDVKFKQEDVEKNAIGFAEWVRESLAGKYDGSRRCCIRITCDEQWIELYLSDEAPIVQSPMRQCWQRIKAAVGRS